MPEIGELLRLVEQDASDGIFATGTQIYASLNGETVLDHAFGEDALGRPMSTDRVHRSHCAGKPITALGIAALVDADELSFFDTIGNVLNEPIPEALADLTIDELLSHRAGLSGLSARETDVLPPEVRRSLVDQLIPRRRGSSVYSNFAGWHLLGRVIEAITDTPAPVYLTQRILEPLNLADELILAPSHHHLEQLGYEIAPSIDLLGDAPLPRLVEVLGDVVAVGEVANMSFATASALGRFYEHLLSVLEGNDGVIDRSSLVHLVSASGEAAFDPAMGRTCAYGHGFMVDLKHHDFGSLRSHDSFGHSGFRGTTAAFADPDSGICASMYYNGAIDGESAIGYLRTARFDMLQRCLIMAGDEHE